MRKIWHWLVHKIKLIIFTPRRHSRVGSSLKIIVYLRRFKINFHELSLPFFRSSQITISILWISPYVGSQYPRNSWSIRSVQRNSHSCSYFCFYPKVENDWKDYHTRCAQVKVRTSILFYTYSTLLLTNSVKKCKFFSGGIKTSLKLEKDKEWN